MMVRRWWWTASVGLALGCGDAPASETTPGATSSSSDEGGPTTRADDTSSSTSRGESGSSDSATATGEGGSTDASSGEVSTSEDASTAAPTSSTGDGTSTGELAGSSESSTTVGMTGTDGSSTTGGSTSTGSSSTTGGSSDTAAEACGNDVLEPGEICDDGDQIGGDGCEADCTSSDDVQPSWFAVLGGSFQCHRGTGVAYDGAGNLLVSGHFGNDIWVRKYDPALQELWTVTYPGLTVCANVHVAVDSADNVIVAGQQWSTVANSPTDVFMAKLDAAGAEIWTTTYDGPWAGWDRPEALAVDSDDNILVGGEIGVTPGSTDMWFAKYDPSGVQQWEVFVYGPNGLADAAFGIAVDPWGNVHVAGVVWGLDADADMWLAKYDADGAEVWSEIVEGPSSFGQDVVADDMGNAYFVGTHGDTADRDIWVRAYDPDGIELWTTAIDGMSNSGDGAMAVSVTPDGEPVAAGWISDVPGSSDADAWLGKFGVDGDPIWERRHDLPGVGGWVAVDVSALGNIALATFGPYPGLSTEAVFAIYPP